MPRVVLSFRVPEESHELADAQNGSKYRAILSDLAQSLRSKIKHGEHTDEQYKCYKEIREELFQLVNEEGVEI